MIWKTGLTQKVIKSTRHYVPSDKYMTGVQFMGHHQGLKGWDISFLKNVGVKLNFEGRMGVVGGPGEEGILRSYESGFPEKWNDSSELRRLFFLIRLIISFVLCQCRLNSFAFKKDIKKRIHLRNYRHHPLFTALIISGMVLKHLYNFENKRSYTAF